MSTKDWENIKTAIDFWREEGLEAILAEDQEQLAAVKTYCWALLSPLKLWDEETDMPDEQGVRELYIRRT